MDTQYGYGLRESPPPKIAKVQETLHFWYLNPLVKKTLPETNGSHPKMDGWNTIVSFSDGLLSGAMLVLGRVPIYIQNP